MSIALIHGDCRSVMPAHAPFDMILADPPYGDTSLKWDKKVEGWHAVARSCIAPTGSMWVFGSFRYFLTDYPPEGAAWGSIYNDVQTTNDATPRTVRRKGRPAHTGNIGDRHYVSEDGGRRVMRSVIYMRSCHGEAIHETEKPVALLSTLIRTSCPTDGIVGDFFAGSGAGGEAAAHTGRRYIGCELDADYHAKATARLRGNLFGVAA